MILDRFFRSQPAMLGEEAPGWNSLYTFMIQNQRSASGEMVSAESAMRQATVLACVKVLAETMASFPLHVYKRTTTTFKDLAPKHPLNIVLGRMPNQWQTPFEFREMMMGHLCLRGNAYAIIIPGILGAVTELWPLNPDKVKVVRLDNNRLLYLVTMPDGTEKRYAQEQIFHLRGISSDGLVGMSPLMLMRDTIGNALAAERYQGKMFANGVRPSGFLKGPAAMKPADAKTAQQTLIEAYGGIDNAHKPMVLGGGLEWQNLGITNVESEFMDQRKMSRNDICGAFRVPPHKAGDLERATFSNIEQSNIQFYADAIMPWCRRWEDTICRDLIVDDDQFYVRFNFEGLLRGDSAARTAFYQSAINTGWMCIDEVRELEDLPPLPDGQGQYHLVQGAMKTLEQVIEGPPPPPAPIIQAAPAPTDAPPDGDAEEEEEAEEEEQMRVAKERGEMLGRIDALQADVAAKAKAIEAKDADSLAAIQRLEASQREARTAADNFREAHASGIATAQELRELKAAHEKAIADAENADTAIANLDAEAKRLRSEAESTQEQLTEAIRRHDGLSERLENALTGNAQLIAACAKQMLKIEAEGIGRQLRKPSGLAGMDAFYAKHAERLTAALQPLIAQRQVLCECQPVAEIVAAHIAESKALLLEAFKGPSEGVAERITNCIAGWECRAENILTTKGADHGDS